MLFNRHHYAGYPAMMKQGDLQRILADARRADAGRKTKEAKKKMAKRKPTAKQLAKSKTVWFNAAFFLLSVISIVAKVLGMELDLARFDTALRGLDALLTPDMVLLIVAPVSAVSNYVLRRYTKKPLNEK